MNTLITALATPYKNGAIDIISYENLVHYQLASGVDALLAIGTTAEAQMLTKSEKRRLIKATKHIACDIPVWVGVGGYLTIDTLREAAVAESLGADGILVAPPAFVKCTPQGYLLHIRDILKTVSVPVMLYNAPSRCNYTLDADVIEQLCQSEQVRYVKDAGSDVNYTAKMSEKLTVLCGNDALLTKMLQKGASGVVSVVSNVAPCLTKRILQNSEQCDKEQLELFNKLAKLSMLEVNPVAIKYMLYKKGIFDSYNVRLPLTRANAETQRLIDKMWNNSAMSTIRTLEPQSW